MNENIKFDYPNDLELIFNKLNKYNIKPIIIGGYVRDYFLNISSKDIDIELYGVESFKQLEEILIEFGDVNNVGKSFGVCKLSFKEHEIDFTQPRIDNKISSGHTGFDVNINKDLDFKTATTRRDFTINAIGYSVIEKKILDPFNGLADIKNKTLKAVDIKTFSQDPLRVLRAISFSSRLNFTMDNELFLLCLDMCNNNILTQLPKERIFGEIKKILLKSQKPSLGFKLIKELDALKFFSPLNAITSDNYFQTLEALDKITKYKTKDNKTNILLMLAILCYKLNIEQTKEFILNLTNEKKLLENILRLKENKFKNNYTDSELFRLANKVNIEYFLIYNKTIHNSLSDNLFKKIKIRAKELNILNKKISPLLEGKDILIYGIEPSKIYSNILNMAYEEQMDLKINTHKEALSWLNNYLGNNLLT